MEIILQFYLRKICGCIAILSIIPFVFNVNLMSQIPIPDKGCYHSAFMAYGHQDFEKLAGKSVAIEMFYEGWNYTSDFPESRCDEVIHNGAIPHITWEPNATDDTSKHDNNQNIIDGKWDNYIKRWAVEIKNWGKPLFIRLGHEMNGNWSTWSGVSNGGGRLDGFGDPLKADGPERFIAAYKHVHDIFKNAGAGNVAWIWCINCGDVPDVSWNRPENYYPGSDYVDWIGLDGYNWGTSQSWSKWQSFNTIFYGLYVRFEDYKKPMMIAEFASAEVGASKASWIKDTYNMIKLIYPEIKAVTWFNINKETDWRINSSQLTLQAYQDAVSDPYFLSNVTYTSVKNKDKEGPVTFSLDPAYPNPFNGYVVIPFTVLADGEYRLEIRNILGEKIKELVYKTFSPGKYSATWNSMDEENNSVPSGIYFARLSSADEKARIQKLVYLK